MKKMLAPFLAVCLVLSMAACSIEIRDNNNVESSITQSQFTQKALQIPEGVGLITAQCVNGDQIFIGISGAKPLIGSVALDDSGELSLLPDEYNYIYAICNTEEGIAVLCGDYPALYYDTNGSLVRHTYPDGDLSILLYSKNRVLMGKIPLAIDKLDTDTNFEFMLCVDGNFYIMSQEYLMIFADSGTQLGRIESTDGINFSSMCLFDNTIIISRGERSISNSQVCVLDLESFTLKSEINLSESQIFALGTSEDGRLLVNDTFTHSVDYLDMTTGEREKLFLWHEMGVAMHNVQQLMWIKGGYVYFELYQGVVNVAEHSFITEERIELTLATNYLSPQLNKLVYSFNYYNGKYKINVVEYDDSGRNKNLDNLRTEVLAGKAPDIYAFDSGDLLRGGSGVSIYEDLIPFFDADPEFSRESIVPALLTAMLREDDKLYWMPYEYSIFSFFAPIDLVGDRTNITLEEAERIAESNELFVFDDMISREWLLEMACNILINQYIDLTAGTCNFENADFIALLEECNKHRSETEPYEPEPIRCLLYRNYLFGVESFEWVLQHHQTFIGFPITGESIGVIIPNLQFAISAQSEYKEAAWEFIRYILSSEKQQEVYNFPVLHKELELQIEKAITGKLVNRQGKEIRFDQSDVGRLWDMIERSSYLIYNDKTILNIIQEEASVYFAGDKTVEEVVRIIQSRVQTYVSEQK